MSAINWDNKDPYIIQNYKYMTYKKLADNLNVKHATLCGRVKKLRKQGIIGGKETIKEPKPIKLEFENLKVGKKYKINGNGINNLKGTLMKEYKNYYLFRYKNRHECFLKVDFAIGEYRIEEVR